MERLRRGRVVERDSRVDARAQPDRYLVPDALAAVVTEHRRRAATAGNEQPIDFLWQE
jgi:hypothetical protein